MRDCRIVFAEYNRQTKTVSGLVISTKDGVFHIRCQHKDFYIPVRNVLYIEQDT